MTMQLGSNKTTCASFCLRAGSHLFSLMFITFDWISMAQQKDNRVSGWFWQVFWGCKGMGWEGRLVVNNLLGTIFYSLAFWWLEMRTATFIPTAMYLGKHGLADLTLLYTLGALLVRWQSSILHAALAARLVLRQHKFENRFCWCGSLKLFPRFWIVEGPLG